MDTIKLLCIPLYEKEEDIENFKDEEKYIKNICKDVSNDPSNNNEILFDKISSYEDKDIGLIDIKKKIVEYKPDIVHFSGHGTSSRFLVASYLNDENQRVGNAAKYDVNVIGHLLEGQEIQLLFLNSCFSQQLAKDLANKDEFLCVLGFEKKITTSIALDYSNLYDDLLKGMTVKKAIEKANNITHGNNFNIKAFFQEKIKSKEDRYKITGNRTFSKELLKVSQKIHGKELVKFLGEDDLAQIWLVSEDDEEYNNKYSIMRLFYCKDFEGDFDKKLESNINNIKNANKPYLRTGVLKFKTGITESSNPYVRYYLVKQDLNIQWYSIKKYVEEKINKKGLKNSSEFKEQANLIVLRLAQIIQEAHENKIFHGRLNIDSIVLASNEDLSAITFGELEPKITDFGLFSLTENINIVKDINHNFSPRLDELGNDSTLNVFDDYYSLVSIWFWLHTQEKLTPDKVKNVGFWMGYLEDFIDNKEVKYSNILDILNNAYNHEFYYKNNDKLVEEFISLLKKLIPFDKQNKKLQKISNIKNILSNCLGMKFTLITKSKGDDEYKIGSMDKMEWAKPDENECTVQIRRDFYISQSVMSMNNLLKLAEITKDRFLMEAVGIYKFLNDEDRELPATMFYIDDEYQPIDWESAKYICELLNSEHHEIKKTERGKRYRLPEEVEWEVACRAGTMTAFNTNTDILNLDEANFKHEESSFVHLKPVVSYPCNGYSLYQMHGNVWEFCDSNYTVEHNTIRNPKNKNNSDLIGLEKPRWYSLERIFFGNRLKKVIRGGDFNSKKEQCRSSNREYIKDNSHSFEKELYLPRKHIVGIRLVYEED